MLASGEVMRLITLQLLSPGPHGHLPTPDTPNPNAGCAFEEECVICMDRAKTHIVVPCMHVPPSAIGTRRA